MREKARNRITCKEELQSPINNFALNTKMFITMKIGEVSNVNEYIYIKTDIENESK